MVWHYTIGADEVVSFLEYLVDGVYFMLRMGFMESVVASCTFYRVVSVREDFVTSGICAPIVVCGSWVALNIS